MKNKKYLFSSGEFARLNGINNVRSIITMILAYSVRKSLERMDIIITPVFKPYSWS